MWKGNLESLGLFDNCTVAQKSSLVENDFGGDYRNIPRHKVAARGIGNLNGLLRRAAKYQRSGRGSISGLKMKGVWAVHTVRHRLLWLGRPGGRVKGGVGEIDGS